MTSLIILGEHGDRSVVDYKRIDYIPLQVNQIGSIQIVLRDSFGKLIDFDFGVVTLKLHFRRIRGF